MIPLPYVEMHVMENNKICCSLLSIPLAMVSSLCHHVAHYRLVINTNRNVYSIGPRLHKYLLYIYIYPALQKKYACLMNNRRSFFQEPMLTSRICVCQNFLMRSNEWNVSTALSILRAMMRTNESYENIDITRLVQAEATCLQPTIKGWRWFGALTFKGSDDRT